MQTLSLAKLDEKLCGIGNEMDKYILINSLLTKYIFDSKIFDVYNSYMLNWYKVVKYQYLYPNQILKYINHIDVDLLLQYQVDLPCAESLIEALIQCNKAKSYIMHSLVKHYTIQESVLRKYKRKLYKSHFTYISDHYDISLEFMLEYKSYLDFARILLREFNKGEKMNKVLVDRLLTRECKQMINWAHVSSNIILDAKILERVSYDLNWDIISKRIVNNDLKIFFYFAKKLDWEIVSKQITLDENTIKRFKKYLVYSQLLQNPNLTPELLKYVNKIFKKPYM
ncbi:MAG: hypothetical protein ACRDD8_10510 [Bacteroidales bacterium]